MLIKYYKNIAEFNFDEHSEYKDFFEKSKDGQRIFENLSMASGQKIVKGDTLILFDEIQECPQALNSLKYFCEKLPEYHIVCACSLLGVMLAKTSFPVGKVNVILQNILRYTRLQRSI